MSFTSHDVTVLCLRGAESDLVLRETTQKMLQRGPGALALTQVVEIESLAIHLL